jgi:uncharacterized membrane protein YdjX (TVP38/TMEM64 family)
VAAQDPEDAVLQDFATAGQELTPHLQHPAGPAKRRGVLDQIIALLAVVLGFTVLGLLVVNLTGGAEKFRSMVEQSGSWAPVVYVLLKSATYVIAPISGTPLKLAAGAMFGTWEGSVLTIAGDAIGGSINFWIARLLGRAGARRFVGRRAVARVDAVTDRVGGWKALLVARLFFSTMYDFVSYAAGLSSIRYWHFLLVTVFGGIPVALFLAAIGDAAVQSQVATVSVLAGGLLLLLVAVAIRFARVRGRKRCRAGTADRGDD